MQGTASPTSRRRVARLCPPRMTAVPLTSPTSASVEPPFVPPAGDFCQQRQKSPKTPLETAFQDFLTRVGYDFALTCPTRNRFSGFSDSKDCASTAFRDALSRDAAPCRGGCLDALPRGYRQIFRHDGQLCPPRMTAAPLTSPHVRKRGPPFCLRRVTFVSSDKSHQKRRLKLRFKTSSRASAMISR